MQMSYQRSWITERHDTGFPDRGYFIRLCARIADGDHTAEEELVDEFRSGLVLFLRRRVHDEAEDLCHETIRIAIESLRLRRIRKPASLPSYLHGIALRLVLAHRRRVRRQAECERAFPALTPPRREILHESRLQEQVMALIGRLRDRDREVLKQIYVAGTSKAEICLQHALRPDQFDVIKCRAIARLRRLLNQPPVERVIRVHYCQEAS